MINLCKIFNGFGKICNYYICSNYIQLYEWSGVPMFLEEFFRAQTPQRIISTVKWRKIFVQYTL